MPDEYKSDIVLGRRYRDRDTNFAGVSIAITFYRYDGERVQLRALVSDVPVDHWFDSAALERVDSGNDALGFKQYNGDGNAKTK